MTELKNGLILTQSKVKNTKFTFNGKDIELKQDENNPLLYTARSSLTEDEKKAGNRDYEFFLNFGDAEGVVSVNILPPKLENDPDFKDLNDAEKLTKLNSIAYQYKTTEPTDIGKGLDEVLQTSVNVPPQNENFAENKNKTASASTTGKKKSDEDDNVNIADIKKIEETHSKKQQQQQQKQDEPPSSFPSGNTVKVNK